MRSPFTLASHSKDGGGGGAGLGGGLFVADNKAGGAAPAKVTLDNVVFAGDSAVGGAGSGGISEFIGGGGGLGGSGGAHPRSGGGASVGASLWTLGLGIASALRLELFDEKMAAGGSQPSTARVNGQGRPSARVRSMGTLPQARAPVLARPWRGAGHSKLSRLRGRRREKRRAAGGAGQKNLPQWATLRRRIGQRKI
jgi:hypothetical protein